MSPKLDILIRIKSKVNYTDQLNIFIYENDKNTKPLDYAILSGFLKSILYY